MISKRSFTKDWIIGIRNDAPGKDPILIEKMIMALTLVENLRLADLDFIFKGGTSLLLLLGRLQRFSIDIDIVLPNIKNLDNFQAAILSQGVFNRIEESKRTGNLPKQHFKFFFRSAIQEKESHILLDILSEKNPYPLLTRVGIYSSLVSVEGEPTMVQCPTKECILGDKLTAFAPHTTGILYKSNKELEMAKQLFDVATLFDSVEDISLVKTTFDSIASKELAYRGMSKLNPDDVLKDAFSTAILIGTRGVFSKDEFVELLEGFRKMAAFVYSGSFSTDTAILCASKVAYLSALILKGLASIDRFKKDIDISSWTITNQDFNKFNKLKKTSPESFYYFFKALFILELEK